MYSYDVSASHRRSTTVPRAIPGMRPSYDAEHPHSATPIYDELYSEYRRLFRALPGDRSGEENLRFAGFAVRDSGYPMLADPRSYPPQQQAFQTYAGQALGSPQFMPNQQTGPGLTAHSPHGSHSTHTAAHTPHAGAQHTPANAANATSDGTGHADPAGRPDTHGHPGGPAAPPGHPTQAGQPAQPAAQFTNGQGWVAAGYLGPVPHPMPATAPAPMSTGTSASTAGPATVGRHRNLLSLPPGRSSDQR